MQWLRRRGWAIAFVVAYLYSFPWFPSLRSANELPRAYLVMAMADEGRFAIDTGAQKWGTTADVSPATLIAGHITVGARGIEVAPKAVRHGHQYSNKAPGSSML